MRLLRLLSLVGVPAVLLACSSSTEIQPAPFLSVDTDRDTYTASLIGGAGSQPTYSFAVITRVANSGDVAVDLLNCPDAEGRPQPVHQIGLVGASASMRSGYAVVHACVGAPPLRLEPGAELTDTLRFIGPFPRDRRTGEPSGSLQIEGEFAISYLADDCRPGRSCGLPMEAGRSNLFRVEVER
jgi:hypothetical protein